MTFAFENAILETFAFNSQYKVQRAVTASKASHLQNVFFFSRTFFKRQTAWMHSGTPKGHNKTVAVLTEFFPW